LTLKSPLNIIKLGMNKLTTRILRTDIIAGFTVALILIPQSLAYASLAGLPAYIGLYAAILPPLIATLFGSSPQLSTGPVAVLSLMTFTAVSPLATPGSGTYITYTIVLTLMFGVTMVILGLLRLGSMISFLSHPVIYGFTNAAAVIIIATQIPAFFGLPSLPHGNLIENLFTSLLSSSAPISMQTFGLSLTALSSMMLLNKLRTKIPSLLIVLVLSTIFVRFTNYPVAVLGTIPAGLPKLAIPNIEAGYILTFLKPVLIMSLIGFTETASIAQAIAIKTKERFDSNKELIGQGLANVAGAFNQSYPVSGSFSRSAISFFAGTRTKVSGVVTSLTVIITILFLSPFLYYIPLSVLSVIIIVSIVNILDLKKIFALWRLNRFDALTAICTFAFTIVFAPQLEYGVFLGIVLSIAYFFYKNTHPRVAFLSLYKDQSLHDAKTYHLDVCSNVAVVRLDAPLFFANTVYFEEEVIKYLSQHKTVTHIIFVATGINEIDLTGLKIFGELIKSLSSANKEVYFSSIRAPVRKRLEKADIIKSIGIDHVFPTTKMAVASVIKELNKKHEHLDSKHCPLKKYSLLEVEDLKLHKTLMQTTAYYYNRLFTKQ
jgi:SulP family sulfate permease